MSEAFRDWLLSLTTEYTMAQGRWVEDQYTANTYFCVLQYAGRSPVVDVRYPTVRVLLVGPRNTPSAVSKLSADAEKIMREVVSDSRTKPCGAANVRALGEPVGPGYTTEDRVWFSLDFELIT